MKDYKVEARIEVLMALGLNDTTLPGKETALDVAVFSLALEVLLPEQKKVFYYLWACTPTWKDLVIGLKEKANKEITIDAAQKLARAAIKRLRERASKHRPLEDWRAEYDRLRAARRASGRDAGGEQKLVG